MPVAEGPVMLSGSTYVRHVTIRMCTMRIILVAMFSIGWFTVAGTTFGQDRKYVPSGEPNRVALEQALYDALPGYVRGIRPRAEILQRAIPKERLPASYVKKVEERLKQVLRVKRKPKTHEDITMMGIPKLRWRSDFIVGYVPCDSCDAADRSRAVEFQANFWAIGLTIHSQGVTVGDRGIPSAEEIVTIISRFLDIPQDKIPRITVERHVGEADGIRFCYGKLRCEWHESTPNESEQEWWSYIPFWMMDGTMHVDLPEVDWGPLGPPASANATWHLLPAQEHGGQ